MSKSNKFTQSVMERLEQEATLQSKEKIQTVQPEKTVSTSAVSEIPPTPAPAVTDLSQYLRPQSRREAKNKTFYLDTNVITAIRQAAKKQNMAESRLVNEVLASVLGVSLED